jgi:hypothetical protein
MYKIICIQSNIYKLIRKENDMMIWNIFNIQYIVYMLWCTSFKKWKCFTIFYILNEFLHARQK